MTFLCIAAPHDAARLRRIDLARIPELFGCGDDLAAPAVEPLESSAGARAAWHSVKSAAREAWTLLRLEAAAHRSQGRRVARAVSA